MAGSLVGAVALLALSCGTDLQPIDTASVEVGASPPPVVLQTVRFEGYRAGSLDLQVTARSARIQPLERRAELEHVRIEFADLQNGDVVIRADSASVDLEADDFLLRGAVEGTIGDDQQFSTAEVRYEAAKERLWTDRPVRVTRHNLLLEGQGMEIDLPARRLVIRGEVSTRLQGGG